MEPVLKIYQSIITDIYATSFDYNKDGDITKEFFATVQNKPIFAISNHTAAELIETQSDIENPNMGFTTWKKAPNGKILQSDVVISKNYLNQNELSRLNSLVEGFLNLAESRAEDRIPMGMKDWKELLDDYLELRRLPILVGKGKISAEETREHVLEKYEKFRVVQDENFISDFDQMILDIKRLERK